MKKNASIMVSSIEDLHQLILLFMVQFEDAQQLVYDMEIEDSQDIQNYLEQEWESLEKYYHQIKKSNEVSEKDRNSIRLIVKYAFKMIPEKVAMEIEAIYKNVTVSN